MAYIFRRTGGQTLLDERRMPLSHLSQLKHYVQKSEKGSLFEKINVFMASKTKSFQGKGLFKKFATTVKPTVSAVPVLMSTIQVH